uniref:BRCT domain-containing protein n=1 Tax=Globisporangium ultimum (strain ATCC 200006 / CBS 805.95 / DAOM BR144) TaxID=431595 RepID=K3W5C9_GLOUD
MWMGASAPRDAKKRKPQTQLGEHHGGSFGVYMAHKIQKLRNQNDALTSAAAEKAATPPPRDNVTSSSTAGASNALFGDVHVFVDGYTVPSKDEIRRLMLMHGGGFEHYETSRVTHIIATHLPASKLLQYNH